MMTGKVMAMEVMPNEEVALKVKTVEVMTMKLMAVKKLKIPGEKSFRGYWPIMLGNVGMCTLL